MVKQLIEKQKAAGVSQQREGEQQPANPQTSSSSPPPFLVQDALPTTLNIGYPSLTSDVYHAFHQSRDRNKTKSSVYLHCVALNQTRNRNKINYKNHTACQVLKPIKFI